MITNLINDRGNAVRNQFIITGEENGKKVVTFQSYESRICDIVYDCGMGFDCLIRLGRDWDYSRTTSKYLYQFLTDYGFAELNNKKAIESAINRGHTKKQSIAIMYDETMR